MAYGDNYRNVVKLHQENKELSQAEIGRIVGLSRQRVHVILKRNEDGKPREKPGRKRVIKGFCLTCGNPLPTRNKYFCSRVCYGASFACNYVSLECAYCGKTITIRKARLKLSNRHFCSHRCQMLFYCELKKQGK
jgi:hypothetical protein